MSNRVAIYTKKKSKEENVNEYLIGKVSWMKIELEDYDVEIIEFVDNHIRGSYQELNRLISLVKADEIDSILVWDFDEITLEMINKLVKVCNQKEVCLEGFLTRIAI